MLQKLILRNFQCHKSLVINFDKRITTIVGPSDIGKSAIIRALRWVMLNKPDGSAFVKTGEEFASVKIVIDGHEIVRKRKGSSNIYKLDDEELKAFGRGDLPDVIKNILNITPNNFQQQHDAAYWFSLPGGQISKALNTVMDLDIMDESLTRAVSLVRKSNEKVETVKDFITTSKAELEDLSYVPDLEKDWAVVENVQKQLTETDEDIQDLETYSQNIDKITGTINKFKGISKDWNHVAIIYKSLGAHESIMEELEAHSSEYLRLKEQLRDKQQCLQKLKSDLPSVCPTCKQTLKD